MCNMMAVVIASGRLYAECRYFNYPTLYKAKGQSVSSRFFEGLVSFTGAQFTWPLISFGFWFWSVNLMNNLPKMSYVSDLSGSFEVLFNSGGFWALLLMAMVIVGVSTFSLVLVSEAVKGPLRSTIANEKARIEAKTKGGGGDDGDGDGGGDCGRKGLVTGEGRREEEMGGAGHRGW